MKVLEVKDLRELLKRNSQGQYGPRNKAAIGCAALWGLTASELSLLPLKAVMNQDGTMKIKSWQLLDYVAYNGFEQQ